MEGDYSLPLLTGTATKAQLPGATAFTDQSNLFNGSQGVTGNLDISGVYELGGNPILHTFGTMNTFVGLQSGNLGNTSFNNTAVGIDAGQTIYAGYNTTGTFNTFLGNQSGPLGPGASTQLNNATAVGALAVVGADNSLVLGSIAGLNGAGSNVNVGIGTATPGMALDVVGDIRTSGCVMANGSSTGTCLSDERLKTDIQPFSPVLAKLVLLRPVSYNWRADEHPELHLAPGRNFGLVAQEVEQALPEMVSSDARAFKRVNYGELPYLMLQAIRELKSERDSLADEVQKDAVQIRGIDRDKDEQINQLKKELQQQQEQLREIRVEMATLRSRSESGGNLAAIPRH